MVDKVLITNALAQTRKYGSRGYNKVRQAIGELVAADAVRGISTLVVDVSNPSEMKRYKTTAVSDVRSEVQNKNAVDSVYSIIQPHYLVLVDGPDVIPHIRLNNPIPKDRDRNVPSDLPYASDRRLTKRDISDYAAVTRVVGRIPGVTGANDPVSLISQIKSAAAFKSRRRQDYLSHFAISSSSWRKSTEQSVDTVFRSKTIKISPPTESPGIGRMLDHLSHFINCDGMKGVPEFYGLSRSKTVVSLTGEDVAKKAKRNTIVVAECCYGAQLFDPSAAQGKVPIANAYLNAGAIAFFGSTNIAYGAPTGNGGADLIAQDFLINMLKGASIGRSCLQARQNFVRSQKMGNPVNLKALGQFILLGDPSLQPVRDEDQTDEFSQDIDPQAARTTRRVVLAAAGVAAASCSSFPGKKITERKTKLHKSVRKIAQRRGIRASADAIQSYQIVGRYDYANEMKARDLKQRVFIVAHQENGGRKSAKGTPLTRVLVAYAQNGNLTNIFEYVRR
jgi:Peptidase family C25